MLATVSMQPMARPASAMTEASTFTSRQKGMVANTREMAREEAKRAHSDWARLRGGGRGQWVGAADPPAPSSTHWADPQGSRDIPVILWSEGEGSCGALLLISYRLWARCLSLPR